MQVFHGTTKAGVTLETVRPSRNGVTYYAVEESYALAFALGNESRVHSREIDENANWLDLTAIAADAEIDGDWLQQELSEYGVVVVCPGGEMELAQHLMAIRGLGDALRDGGYCGIVLREYREGDGESVAYGLV